jgi:hypothetical protein
MFAVWGYVIAHMKPDAEVGAQVELNPKLLSAILGEDERVVQGVIDRLCEPDEISTSKAEEGRRLVRLGQFAYRVVNGAHYMAIRNEDERREYFRIHKRKERARLRKGKPLHGEVAAVKALDNGDEREFERIAAAPRRGVGEEVKSGVVWVKSVAQAVATPAKVSLSQSSPGSPPGRPLAPTSGVLVVPEVTISLEENESPSGP